MLDTPLTLSNLENNKSKQFSFTLNVMKNQNPAKKGYPDFPKRVPPGWRVAQSDKWLINNEDPGERNAFDIINWRLEICGEVQNPQKITYEEFQKLPHVTKTLDHHCVDGWSFLGQVWTGVEMSTIIEESRVSPDANYVLAEGAGGISQSFAIKDDLLLADGQNGGSLPRPAGYPLRIVAPGQFGNRSVKWLRKLTFSRERLVDTREQKYETYGILDMYLTGMRDRDPWTVDNSFRKSFLQRLFAQNTETRRVKKRQEYLNSETHIGTHSLRTELKVEQQNSTGEISLCKLSDLADGGPPSKFVVDGYEILVMKAKGKVYAMEPMCTHHGADLSKGKINFDARTIKCPLHGACFDLESGDCLLGSNGSDGDAFPKARIYQIRVDPDRVLVSRRQEWGQL